MSWCLAAKAPRRLVLLTADDRRVVVHGYTLMSNHIHLVVTGKEVAVRHRAIRRISPRPAKPPRTAMAKPVLFVRSSFLPA